MAFSRKLPKEYQPLPDAGKGNKQKQTPAPLTNTNPRSLPGNPSEGEQNRKMKENYDKQHRWDNNNPYYPKKEFTGKYTSNKKVKVGGNDVNSSKKRIAEAFGSAAKTKSGKLVSGSNVNTGHGKVKKSGKGNNSFTMTAPKTSKSKKSKKK